MNRITSAWPAMTGRGVAPRRLAGASVNVEEVEQRVVKRVPAVNEGKVEHDAFPSSLGNIGAKGLQQLEDRVELGAFRLASAAPPWTVFCSGSTP